MRIVIVGTGYVGLVTGAGFADFGNEVLCVDVDQAKIEILERGEIPFYEPGLGDLVARNVRERRLRFGTSLEEATRWGEAIFICVGTPQAKSGRADLRYVFAAAKTIAKALPSYRLIVQKSTVPVGTADKVREIIRRNARRGARCDVASNPEFLREGTAVENFMRPDRVVIGADSPRARDVLREIYSPLYLIETPMVVTGVRSAELIKYAANSFLAAKISFINEMANLSEAVGADVHDVAKGIGLDRRIGPKFLHPGPGFGGSCLPKDTRALRDFARRAGVPTRSGGSPRGRCSTRCEGAARTPWRCWGSRTSPTPTTCARRRRSTSSGRCSSAASRSGSSIRWFEKERRAFPRAWRSPRMPTTRRRGPTRWCWSRSGTSSAGSTSPGCGG